MFTEYPEDLRRALGVRYCTLCVLEPERFGFDLPQLLWANEPFDDAAVVERELLGRGWRDVDVRRDSPTGPWRAHVGGDVPLDGDRWVGFVHSGYAGRIGVGRWPLRSEFLVTYGGPDEGWRATWAETALYDKYDDPHPWVVGLTRHQAELLARADGRTLPTEAETAAAIQVRLDARQAFWDRRDRFYAARAARYATEVADLRAEGARLAETPPHRQREDGEEGRARVVAGIPAVPVRPGESFPLVRFLVGHFSDRPDHGRYHGAYQVRCNRIGIVLDDGVTLDLALHVSMVSDALTGLPGTPYLPAEADYVTDPAFPALKPASSSRHFALSSTVFPASPAGLSLRGWLDGPAEPLRRNPLSIVLTFPGGQEYVTALLTVGALNLWYTVRRYDEGPVGPEVRLYVPDDINLLKPVRARVVSARK